MQNTVYRSSLLASAALLLAVATATPSNAQITSGNVFKNLFYDQTSGAAPSGAPAGAFINGGGTFAGAYTSGTLASPLTTDTISVAPGIFTFDGHTFATQADMDAAYPNGTYIYTLSGSGLTDSSLTMTYTGPDPFTADIPALTATSFAALQSLSTDLGSLTVNFDPFTPYATPPVTNAFTFFTIFNTSQGCGFLSPSATSCTIDPNALTPRTTYEWELDFSDRIAEGDGTLGFDVRTDGTFTTAIPEPATWVMMLAGFAGLGLAGVRSARKNAAAAA